MNRNLRNWIAGILVAAALLGLYGLARGTDRPSPAAQDWASQGSEDEQIRKLRQALQNEGLSLEARESLEEKLQMAERLAAQRASIPVERSTKVPPPQTQSEALALESTPELLEGIFEGSQGLIRPSFADIQNVWQGERNGKAYQVFAGSLPDDPASGLLLVVELQPDKPFGDIQVYPAPQGTGTLRIVAVEENRVVLSTSDNTRLSFDLLSREFGE